MAISGFNWFAIVVSALVGFPLGFLWYGALFGQAWMALTGVTPAQGKAANPLKLYGTVLLLNLVIAVTLRWLIGEHGWHYGAHIGLMAAVCFFATGLGINYLFEFRKLKLWLINSGYMLVMMGIMGAILGAWH
jgi:hypothetical protein